MQIGAQLIIICSSLPSYLIMVLEKKPLKRHLSIPFRVHSKPKFILVEQNLLDSIFVSTINISKFYGL